MVRPRKITIVRDGEPNRFIRVGDTVINTRHITVVQNRPEGGCSIVAGGREYVAPDITFPELGNYLLAGQGASV